MEPAEKTMKITSAVYERILNQTPPWLPETGGILGGRDGTIVEAVFDSGVGTPGYRCRYVPDINKLNKHIEEWAKKGIGFCGMFHSHFYGVASLSRGDISYIEDIMRSMPDEGCQLHFPIVVFPNREMVSFLCVKDGGEVAIKEELISIINM